MELTFDWGGFQNFFIPRRRAIPLPIPPSGPHQLPQHPGIDRRVRGPIYAVLAQHRIVACWSEGENWDEWIGKQISELAVEQCDRELVTVERTGLTENWKSALNFSHSYLQIDALRNEIAPSLLPVTRTRKQMKQGGAKLANQSLKTTALRRKNGIGYLARAPFLFELFDGAYSRFLPSAYGVYLRWSDRPDMHLLILVRRKKVEGFVDPDLSSIGDGRARALGDIAKLLSERYLVPVLGSELPEEAWQRTLRSDHPWKDLRGLASRDELRLQGSRGTKNIFFKLLITLQSMKG